MVTTVIGAAAVAGTSIIQASGNKAVDSKFISGDTLPANLQYDSDHPDKIYVKDGIFVKADKSNKISYNDKEVVNDVYKVTDKTNVILVYDAIYLRTAESK